jgi:hypothetical protein
MKIPLITSFIPQSGLVCLLNDAVLSLAGDEIGVRRGFDRKLGCADLHRPADLHVFVRNDKNSLCGEFNIRKRELNVKKENPKNMG